MGYKMGGSNDPFLGLDQFSRVAHRTQGNTHTSLLKDMIRDTEKQPDEEIYRVQSQRVLSIGTSAPVELGYIALPG